MESYVAGTMQAAGAIFGAFEEEEDEEYDPMNNGDQLQIEQDQFDDVQDAEELDADLKDIQNIQNECKLPMVEVTEEDEAEIIPKILRMIKLSKKQDF